MVPGYLILEKLQYWSLDSGTWHILPLEDTWNKLQLKSLYFAEITCMVLVIQYNTKRTHAYQNQTHPYTPAHQTNQAHVPFSPPPTLTVLNNKTPSPNTNP